MTMKTVAQFRAHLGEQADGASDAELQAALDGAGQETLLAQFRRHVGAAAADATDAELREALDAVTVVPESYEVLAKSLAVEREQRQSLSSELATMKAALMQQNKIIEALRRNLPASSLLPESALEMPGGSVTLTVPEGGIVNRFAPVNKIDVRAVPVTLDFPAGGIVNQFDPKITVQPAAPAAVTLPPMQVTVVMPRVLAMNRTVLRRDGEIVGTRDEFFYSE